MPGSSRPWFYAQRAEVLRQVGEEVTTLPTGQLGRERGQNSSNG
jgi:hypothetical protein